LMVMVEGCMARPAVAVRLSVEVIGRVDAVAMERGLSRQAVLEQFVLAGLEAVPDPGFAGDITAMMREAREAKEAKPVPKPIPELRRASEVSPRRDVLVARQRRLNEAKDRAEGKR
jgi:predicted DNA-binding protein